MDFVPEDGDGVPAFVGWLGFEVELGEAGKAIEGVGRGGSVAAGERPGCLLGGCFLKSKGMK